MGIEAVITLVVMLAFFIVAISGILAVDYALALAMTLLLVFGVLTPAEAFAGFANPALFVIVSFYVVSAALKESGALTVWVQRVLGRGLGVKRATIRMMLPVAAISGFVSNTPVVAMFIPQLQDWARRGRIPASKLLMPLSFASILGGMCTMIGTSTNILLSGLIDQAGLGGQLDMFSPAMVGLPLVLVGVGYFVLVGHRLLPVREDIVSSLDEAQKYAVNMRVVAGGPLDGQSIADAGLRQLQYSFLSELQSGDRIMPAVSPREILHGDDILVFVGQPEAVGELRQIHGLAPAENQIAKLDVPHNNRALIEAVISPCSYLVGKTVKESRFRTRYGGAILSISRGGERLQQKVGGVDLRAGDTLLLEAARGFVPRHRYSRDFLLLSRLDGTTLPNLSKAPVALGLLMAFVVAVVAGWLSLSGGALLLAGAMIATRCLSTESAQRSVDMRVILAIGASLSLGLAVYKTGLAAMAAGGLVALGGSNPLLNLLLVYIATVIVTETITNNAAAVLMFPIALSVANTLGVDAMPFIMTVLFGASASFATPIGYQTNLMVQGPGGYGFADYLRVGLPLTLLVGVVVVGLVPMVWAF